jgi:tetracycline resistance efflux pump
MSGAGVLAIVPTLVVIVAALVLRSTLPGLVLGVLAGHALLDGAGLVGGLADSLQRQLATPAVAWVLLVCGLFGGLIELIVRAGGTAAFASLVTSRIRSGPAALIVAWLMGLAIFIDDFLNALVIGHSLRPVTDRLRVPRERLAYVIDATAAPVCILVPLSTWAVYVAGLLETTGAAAAGGGMRAYLGLIPWAFYGWVAVALVPLVSLGWIPAWGAMRAADRRVAEGGPTAPPGSPAGDGLDDLPADGRLSDFIVPMVVLVAATALSKADALHGVTWALLACAVQQGLVRRRLSAAGIADAACRGVGAMVPALATILLAFALKDVNDRLGLTPLVIDAVRSRVSAATLPAAAFVALAAVTFATGSFWGTYAVALPIVVPLARELQADLPLTLGAVVSAGAFGSHACFFGDTTVLASQASACENLAHAASQLPYVLFGAAITTAAYLACGAWM